MPAFAHVSKRERERERERESWKVNLSLDGVDKQCRALVWYCIGRPVARSTQREKERERERERGKGKGKGV